VFLDYSTHEKIISRNHSKCIQKSSKRFGVLI